MAKFYSPSTGGFYDSAINATMPQDVIAISDEVYDSLLAGLNSGQIITIVGDVPTLSTPVISTAQAAINAGNVLLAAGINITSTSTPELDGTYSLTVQSQLDINAVETYILRNNTFPQGQTTTYWADKAGGIHQFPSVAVFNAFATALADFIDVVEDYQNSGGEVGSLPSPNVTII